VAHSECTQAFFLGPEVLSPEPDRLTPGGKPAIESCHVPQDAPRQNPVARVSAQGNKAAALALKRMLMWSPAQEEPHKPPPADAFEPSKPHSDSDQGETSKEKGTHGKQGRSFADVNGMPHFVILGTGAAAPSKLRSVSA
jgi:hypothetical protein